MAGFFVYVYFGDFDGSPEVPFWQCQSHHYGGGDMYVLIEG